MPRVKFAQRIWLRRDPEFWMGQVTRLRLPEWVLLPERVLGIKRGNGGRIMLAPAAFPHICPLPGCLSCIHTPRVGTSTGKPAARPNASGFKAKRLSVGSAPGCAV